MKHSTPYDKTKLPANQRAIQVGDIVFSRLHQRPAKVLEINQSHMNIQLLRSDKLTASVAVRFINPTYWPTFTGWVTIDWDEPYGFSKHVDLQAFRETR